MSQGYTEKPVLKKKTPNKQTNKDRGQTFKRYTFDSVQKGSLKVVLGPLGASEPSVRLFGCEPG